jgi:hypothetical protein
MIIIIIIIIIFYLELGAYMQLSETVPSANVSTFTHNHVGSIGAPSRTVFVRGTSAEQ